MLHPLRKVKIQASLQALERMARRILGTVLVHSAFAAKRRILGVLPGILESREEHVARHQPCRRCFGKMFESRQLSHHLSYLVHPGTSKCLETNHTQLRVCLGYSDHSDRFSTERSLPCSCGLGRSSYRPGTCSLVLG